MPPPSEIAAFWALVSPDGAKGWVTAHRDELTEILIRAGTGRQTAPLGRLRFLDTLDDYPRPPRIRVLSLPDPMIRDRNRTERLFGFSYRIEIFVPEPKRECRPVRLSALGRRSPDRPHRHEGGPQKGTLVSACGAEPGVKPSAGRLEKLAAERSRTRFAGVERVEMLEGWRS